MSKSKIEDLLDDTATTMACANDDLNAKTPVVPVDKVLLRSLSSRPGPYAEILKKTTCAKNAVSQEVALIDDPFSTIEKNGERSDSRAIGKISDDIVAEARQIRDGDGDKVVYYRVNAATPYSRQTDDPKTNLHYNVSVAPPYLRMGLIDLITASTDRVEFYSTFRRLKETDPRFVKGLARWLRKNTFRLEDPRLDPESRNDWRAPRVLEKSLAENACPVIPMDKDGWEFESELVYIFAGMCLKTLR